MKLQSLVIGALVATVPLTAGAATLSMRVNGPGGTEYFDQGSGDESPVDGVLAVVGATAAGYEYAGSTAIKQDAPPLDQLQASVDVFNKTGGPASIMIEVTGHFSNGVSGDWLGAFTSTANDATGSDWTVSSYIGTSAYGRNMLALSNSGSVTALSNIVAFDPSDYWVTHVFDHEADKNNVSASASADFIAPVPVPAAGLLLVGALGGLGALRHRRKG